MERLVPLKDADRSFEQEFWRRVGAAGRHSYLNPVHGVFPRSGHLGQPFYGW